MRCAEAGAGGKGGGGGEGTEGGGGTEVRGRDGGEGEGRLRRGRGGGGTEVGEGRRRGGGGTAKPLHLGKILFGEEGGMDRPSQRAPSAYDVSQPARQTGLESYTDLLPGQTLSCLPARQQCRSLPRV